MTNVAAVPTEEIARKVLATVDAGLVKGLGVPIPGKMCVEAAVNYSFGLPHGDSPSCVGAAVRAFKIRLNDANWPSDADRTAGMRKLAIAQLGSDTIDQNEFRKIVVVETVKRILPIAFRAAASLIPAHKDSLEGAAVLCEAVVDLASARAAASAGREKAMSARAAYAAFFASFATYLADDADVADAAYADDAADDAAAKPKKHLEVLRLCAQIGLEALQQLKSPGCAWLFLCDDQHD